MTSHEQYRDDLPLLATGALPPEESVLLEQHVRACAECTKELAELAAALTKVGIAQGGVEPPPHLRSRILNQVTTTRVIAVKEKRSRWLVWTWVPVFASMVLALLAFAYRQENKALESENSALRTQARQEAGTLQRSRALLETLTARDAVHVTLTAAGKVAPPEIKTIYSAKHRALVLTANNLAPLAPNKAYQLWLLPSDGAAPVPYGTFKPDSHGNAVLVMTTLEKQTPKAFAVTVEAEAGSKVPTTPILLVGSVTG